MRESPAFPDVAELRTALAEPPIIAGNTRFKYSNHGFGLIGLVIEAVTGEPYTDWIRHTIIDGAGLAETTPDMPIADDVPVASGHSGRLPFGRRVVIPGDNPTNALAAATGFVSTAGDLAKFFAAVDPAARRSPLAVESRREMIRRQWRDPPSSRERYYGLGIWSGNIGRWNWFGHGGSFQGFISGTAGFSGHGLSVSILTNARDGPADQWVDGVNQILAFLPSTAHRRRACATGAGDGGAHGARWIWCQWAVRCWLPISTCSPHSPMPSNSW